jgi:DNA-binding CsgD family transcriptional regulator
LYLKRRLSTYKIASILDCNVRTVANKMKKYSIKSRPRKKPDIKRATFLKLYFNDRLSLKEIGKLFNLSSSGVLKKSKSIIFH